jgi:nucleotide-binding universal stress UspA family protein
MSTQSRSETVILICYDGSDDAKAAIKHVGPLLPGAAATVLTVWEPFSDVSSGSPKGRLSPLALITNVGDANDTMLAQAREVADEGAQLANEAGLKAEPATDEQGESVAEAILSSADRLDADIIVLGSRGLGGVGSLLGSVSHRVLQHADRPVLVIPSAAVAARRHKDRQPEATTA